MLNFLCSRGLLRVGLLCFGPSHGWHGSAAWNCTRQHSSSMIHRVIIQIGGRVSSVLYEYGTVPVAPLPVEVRPEDYCLIAPMYLQIKVRIRVQLFRYRNQWQIPNDN